MKFFKRNSQLDDESIYLSIYLSPNIYTKLYHKRGKNDMQKINIRSFTRFYNKKRKTVSWDIIILL